MSDVSVTFGAKDENLARTFKSVGDQTKSLGDSFKSMLLPLAAIGAAFMGLRKMAGDFKAAIDMGGRLNDLAARTGETAGNLMLLERAFQNAGAGAEAVGPVINKLQRFMVEASQRGGEQAKTMERLGLSFEDLKTKSPLEQLRAIAAKIADMPDPAERSAVAMQVLGRSGGELVPLFRAMGVELETARAQLGSAPAIIDKANQALDTIGDNMGAIAEKSKEFALGLLSELLPGIVAVTERLATLDAAGVGAKLSEYARQTLDWATETFKLGEALASVELAFKAITSGNIGDGLKLLFLQARDTALNAINEVWAAISAIMKTVADSASALFSFDGPIFKVAVNAITLIGKHIELTLAKAFLAAIPDIELFGDAIRSLEKDIAALPYEIAAFENMLGTSTKAAVEEVGKQFTSFPEQFAKSYEANIKNPLFEMEERLAETASHSAKVQENLKAAADSMLKISDAAPTLDSPAPRVPSAADIGNFNAEQARLQQARNGGGGATRERQLTPAERKLMEQNEGFARELESRGFFSAAEREMNIGKSKVDRSRERQASRSLQKELGLSSGAAMSPEEMARREGLSLNQEEFKKRVKEIEDEIKNRAGQGDGTEKASGKGGGAGGPQQSPLERIVAEIKELVAKIEPKLPTAAMGV